MLAEKIQHFLGVLFILSLILTQSLIYIAVRALETSTPTVLPAVFIEPLAGSTITRGQTLNIRASLGEEGAFYSVVFFTLGLVDSTNQLNFEASRQDDNSWMARNAWDSSSWPIGTYRIRATANVYNSQGLLERTLVSEFQNFILAAAPPANDDTATSTVPNTDQPGSFTPSINSRLVRPEANQAISLAERTWEAQLLVESSNLILNNVRFDLYLQNSDNLNFTKIRENIPTVFSESAGGQGYYGAHISSAGLSTGIYKLVALADGTVSTDSDVHYEALALGSSVFTLTAVSTPETTLTVHFLSPSAGQNLSGTAEISVELSRDLASGHSLRAYFISSASLPNLDISRYRDRAITLSRTSDSSLRYRASASLAIYSAGQYSLLVYDEINDRLTLLGSLALNINQVSDDTSGRGYIILLNPLNGSTVRESLLHLSIQTSRNYQSLSLELVKTDDQALSSGEVSIPRLNGLSWVRTLTLADYLTDGLYNLIVTAAGADDNATSTAEQEVFNLTLDRFQDQADITSPYLTLGVLRGSGTDNSIQDLVTLRAKSNLRAQVYFVWRDTVEREEVWRLPHTTLLTVPEAETGSNVYQYETVMDSRHLANGNYYFSGELVSAGQVGAVSSDRLVTIYNGGTAEGSDADEDQSVVRLEKIYKKLSDGISRLVFYIRTTRSDSKEALELTILDENNTNLGQITLEKISSEQARVLNPSITLESDDHTFYRGEVADSLYSGSATHLISLARLDAVGNTIQRTNALRLAIREGSAQVPEEIALGEGRREDDDSRPADSYRDQASSTMSGVSRSGLGAHPFTACSDVNIREDKNCQAFRALLERRVDQRCWEQSIYDPEACEDYLHRLLVDPECQEQSIVEREECKDYLLEKYASNVECRLTDLDTCHQVLRDKYLNRLVVRQKERKTLAEVINPLIGKNLTVGDLIKELSDQGLSPEALPLKSNQNITIFISQSRGQVLLEEINQLTMLFQAVLILDSDGDSLADDLENYYQTDPNQPDSDGDGYTDGLEISNNYDPSGPGVLSKERTGWDKAILSGQALEQPKASADNFSTDLTLADIANEADGLVLLSGTGPADTWLTLYLYSDLPLVMVTKTDASGNWSYTINRSLTDGHHQAYVTINDDTGRIREQSAPLSFLVKEAKAVTADEYFDEAAVETVPDSLLRYYIFGGVLLVLLALLIIYLIHRNKHSLNLQ